MEQLMKNVFAGHGYNMVALPKSDIRPLLLLSEEGDHLSSLESELDMLFEADLAPLPLPLTDAADLEGQEDLKFDLKTGFQFLDGLFRKLGLKSSKLKAHAQGNRSYQVSFSFEQVKEEKVSLLDVDNYLSGAIPLENAFRTYTDRLKKSELFVITSVLKSNAFTIQVEDAQGQELALDTTLEVAAEMNTTINRNHNNGFMIAGLEDQNFVFAFKAVQILYDKTRWFEFWKPADAGFKIRNQEGLVLRGVADFPVKPLPVSQTLIEI